MNSSEYSLNFSSIAFKKSVLHSLKYLCDDVIGVYTGIIEKGSINVLNAFPLFHSRVTTPTLEASFMIIEGVLTNSNEIILGVYESLAKPTEELNKYSDITIKIAEKIHDTLNINPILVRIQEDKNHNAEIDEPGPIKDYSLEINICELNKDGLKNIEKKLEKEWDFYSIVSELDRNNHRKIIDFDNHFEDCTLNFMNDYIQNI